MRVLFTDGTLKPMKQVSPLVIKTYEVNGKIRRDFYKSKGLTDSTNGVLLLTDANPYSYSDCFFIGNLDKDTVSGIIQTALKKNYIDLTMYNLVMVESQAELANIGDKPYIFQSCQTFVNPNEEKLNVMPLTPFNIPRANDNNLFGNSGFDCSCEEDNYDEEGDEDCEENF